MKYIYFINNITNILDLKCLYYITFKTGHNSVIQAFKA